jgi:competence ComEA-like helix-hairpin-helix protein
MPRSFPWRAVAARALDLIVPPEGESVLVLLLAGLLLLGALRQRLEPWLQGVAADPPLRTLAAAAVDPDTFGKVDLNRAGAEELASLPRIGPALAARLVADRELHGSFLRVEDLDRVRGVGPGVLLAIRDEITVGPASGDTLQAE